MINNFKLSTQVSPRFITLLLALNMASANATTESTLMTRKLTTPTISGLYYSGDQQSSGMTDTKGRFSCKPQETISFKLGATLLGTYQCDTSQTAPLSLMSLAHLSLVNDQLFSEMLKAQLTLKTLPYNQWENRLALLQVLDKNQKLEDGIELSAAVYELDFLKNHQLNFARDENHFKVDLRQLLQQATLAQLYSDNVVAQLSSPVTLLKDLETETQGQFTFTGYVLTDFTENTAESKLQEKIVSGNKGYPLRISYIDFNDSNENWQAQLAYDAKKRLKQVLETTDSDAYLYNYFYEPTQHYLQKIVGLPDGDLNASPTFTKTWLQNTQNQYINIVEEEVLDEERVKSIKDYYYDTYQRLNEVKSRTNHLPLTGSIPTSNEASVMRIDYDAAGNLQQVKQTNTDATGQALNTVFGYKFNALGQLKQQSYQLQTNTVTTANQMDYVYTSAGAGKQAKKTYWNNGVMIGFYQDTFEYNHSPLALKGSLTKQKRDYYNMSYQNGKKPVRSIIASYQYYPQGQPKKLVETEIEYQDGYGVALDVPESYKAITTFVYDTAGNITSIATDFGDDDQINASYGFAWKAVSKASVEELEETLQLVKLTNNFSYISEDPNSADDLKIDLYTESAKANKLAKAKLLSNRASTSEPNVFKESNGQYTSYVGAPGTGPQDAATVPNPVQMMQTFP